MDDSNEWLRQPEEDGLTRTDFFGLVDYSVTALVPSHTVVLEQNA